MNIDSSFDYIIFTDGSCLSNPGGVGGFAYVKVNTKTFERVGICGGSPSTTNNRMEMMACIAAFETIEEPSKIMIVTDSTYLKDTYVKNWIYYWKHNCWRTSSQKPVKNKDLWLMIDSYANKHSIEWVWVKGHNSQPENELCDKWAREMARRILYYMNDSLKGVKMTPEEIESKRVRFM